MDKEYGMPRETGTTYGTNKTSPTPFSTESFNSLFMVPDTLLTPFAFG